MLKEIERYMDKSPEVDEAQVTLDNDDFVKKYRRKIGLIGLGLLLGFISLGVFYVTAKRLKPPELFGIDQSGAAWVLTTASLPNQSRDAVKDWAREAIQKLYTFNFLNIETSIQGAKPYFTKDAWAVFSSTIIKSDLVKQVKKNKLTVSVVAKEEPMIEMSLPSPNGEFAWKLIVPVTMSYAGDTPTKTQDLIFRVTIVRVPTLENPKGLGVLQLSSK